MMHLVSLVNLNSKQPLKKADLDEGQLFKLAIILYRKITFLQHRNDLLAFLQ